MKTIKITWAGREYSLEIAEGANAPKTIADDIIIRAIIGPDSRDYYFTADGRLTWHLRTASGRISTRLNQATCPVTVEGFAYLPYIAGEYMRYAWVAQ
jgi:hypothetical protein